MWLPLLWKVQSVGEEKTRAVFSFVVIQAHLDFKVQWLQTLPLTGTCGVEWPFEVKNWVPNNEHFADLGNKKLWE